MNNLLAQKAPRVEHDPHGLASFHLKYARDEFGAARRGRPADLAEFIACPVFAQAFKLAAQSTQALAPPLQGYLARADKIQRLLFGLFEIGEDAHARRGFRHGPALGQPHRGLVAQIKFSDGKVSALAVPPAGAASWTTGGSRRNAREVSSVTRAKIARLPKLRNSTEIFERTPSEGAERQTRCSSSSPGFGRRSKS